MKHLLLVDDDQDIIDANRARLEKAGYRITAAFSAQQAWETLSTVSPDLIVLDAMMEEFTSGFELAQDIQAKYPKIPVIMLTGVSEHMKADWEYKPEGDGTWLPVHKFLKKPVDPALLIKEIEALLALAEKGLPPAKPAKATK